MEELEFIIVDRNNNRITPSTSLLRLPRKETHGPKILSLATKFIINHIEAFVALEGTKSQRICYASGILPKEVAEYALRQTEEFKRWLQLQFIDNTDDDSTIPVIHVGFTKMLGRNEL